MTIISNSARFTASALALLMFLTSMVFTVDVHYCGGHIKSINFFGKAKACYELAEASISCPNHPKLTTSHEGHTIGKKNCCENKSFHFQADQDQTTKSNSFTINQPLQQFLTAFVLVFCSNERLIDNETPPFSHYRPPLLARDIPVLIQSFLI